ncbi:MAG TPA: ferritin-like domain-containing protein [Thermoleophilaceae bacterium]|nr:ferritin-like domain-containing protein [Thermoleophilaceae bacterium]
MRTSRRTLLAGAGVAVALGACGEDDAPRREAGARSAGDARLLNRALALEHTAVAAYDLGAQLVRARELGPWRAIAEQEREHARRLSQLVRERGGRPAQARLPEEYERSFPRLRTPGDALRFAADLENRIVRSYLESLAKLRDPALRRLAAAIATSEAEHLVLLGELRGVDPAPDAFVTGTT